MSLDYIRLSHDSKERLVRLKRKTGIENWNVLCRWAFCLSLAEPSVPPDRKVAADSNVEMTWKVFGGQQHDVYYALLKERCLEDGFEIDTETLSKQFHLHLARGIAYLAGMKSLKSIDGLTGLAEQTAEVDAA